MSDLPTDPDEREASGRPRLRVPLPDENRSRDEIGMARAFLAFLRESAILKVEGLDVDQLRWQPAPGANSAGALLMHLSDVERFWIRQVYDGQTISARIERSASFAVPEGWTTGEVVALYRTEIVAADLVLDAETDAGSPSRAGFRHTTLRWVLFHMVEEVSRHVGHLDLTRELIDGSRGR